MLNVLQLSDIHYGADYDGKFDTADQWAAVIADAHKLCPDGYDAVVITGDLVDDDPKVSDEIKRERYKTIIADAVSLRRNDKCPLLVTPVILDDYVVKPKHQAPAQAPSQAKPKAKAKSKGKKA